MSSEDEEFPDDIVFPPNLLPGMEELLEAFWELSTDRQLGLAVGPIPFSSIVLWLDRHGYDHDAGDELRACFREMDAAYLAARSGKPAPVPPDKAGAAAPMPKGKGRKLSMKLFDALWGVE